MKNSRQRRMVSKVWGGQKLEINQKARRAVGSIGACRGDASRWVGERHLGQKVGTKEGTKNSKT